MTVSLNCKNGYYSVIFRHGGRNNLRQLKRALGTTDAKLALEYKVMLQRLCDEQAIHPFDEDFCIKQALNIVETQISHNVMSVQQAIAHFLEAKRGLKTWRAYQIELNCFMNYGPYTYFPIQRISSTIISEYIWRDTNKGRVLSNATKAAYWRYLHALFEHLLKNGFVSVNPVKSVTKPKATPVRNEVIATDQDLQDIFIAYDRYQAEQEQKNANYRDWQRQLWFKPLILLYNATGCRRSQPLAARWADLEGDYSGIWVKGIKYERSDKVYYYIKHKEAKEALQNLRKVTAGANQDYIFANPKTEQPLTAMHVYRVFKKYAKLAGVNPALHLHGLRHKSVTDDLNSGVPIHNVSMQHQHSSIAITEKIYAHLNHKFVKDGYESVYGKRKRK